MLRLFETNEIRAHIELEGIWDFAVVGANEEEPQFKYRLPVPGCWEMHPDLLKYRGIGIYRRKVEVDQLSTLRFLFKGVSHTAKIFFDGKEIASHYNAYTAFSAIVKNVEPGQHELKVWVDNGFHENSTLHIPNDYYTYGGIIRPVSMEKLSNVFIERIQFTPFMLDEQWSAKIQVTVCNISDSPQKLRLKGDISTNRIDFNTVIVEAGEKVTVSTNCAFNNIETWCTEQPKLYLCNIKLFNNDEAEPVDDLIERVGFRTITTDNGKIQLNGDNIILKGFNRHEDHPLVGAAFPLSLMVQDVDLMEDMGANCVRTSHYPNDERFLDLCDERGLLVWEENHARGFQAEHMNKPLFAVQCEAVNREMVEQHVNHPSIFTWGILNECASNTVEGRVHYKRQLADIRLMDPSRPVTFASHHRDGELCFDLADIVSVNLYPGWYTDEDPSELADQLKLWADAAGGAGKPFIMSEFGADAYYGLHNPNHVRGTEERQADILKSNLAAYMSKEFISGMFIWQFCDCRVTESLGWLLNRAGTQNVKGIVDGYRRPKLAYSVVKDYFTR